MGHGGLSAPDIEWITADTDGHGHLLPGVAILVEEVAGVLVDLPVHPQTPFVVLLEAIHPQILHCPVQAAGIDLPHGNEAPAVFGPGLEDRQTVQVHLRFGDDDLLAFSPKFQAFGEDIFQSEEPGKHLHLLFEAFGRLELHQLLDSHRHLVGMAAQNLLRQFPVGIEVHQHRHLVLDPLRPPDRTGKEQRTGLSPLFHLEIGDMRDLQLHIQRFLDDPQPSFFFEPLNQVLHHTPFAVLNALLYTGLSIETFG